jgi:uncharacterized repeat protein (TIGR03803 family)
MRSLHFLRVPRCVLCAAATATLIGFASLGSASAYTQKTLYSFCAKTNCVDGGSLLAGVMDASGNLYGTTELGGQYGRGVVFELVLNANKTKYHETVLYDFCAKPNCTDGSFPQSADLIMDVDGNLYGAAAGGGKYNSGGVFKLTHKSGGWSSAIIHSFCAKANCTDGNVPETGLAYAGQASGARWDESSPLFGTTAYGGANNKGLAYELVPNGSGWTYKVLHGFNPPEKSASPGPLLVDSSGNLFGVTYFGGKYDAGALYKLAAGTWKETTLHNFCAETNCTDGAAGVGRLTMDAAGNLFGAANYGGSGAHCADPESGCGVVFERPPGGPYTVIYNFCSKSNCKDGSYPLAGLIMDADGTLYGTTDEGGSGGGGTAFTLTHAAAWTERVLYGFCGLQNCTDGSEPAASLTLDKKGNVFGTTSTGGANNYGTVFELKP